MHGRHCHEDFVAGRTASYNPTLKFHKSRLYAIDGKPQKLHGSMNPERVRQARCHYLRQTK